MAWADPSVDLARGVPPARSWRASNALFTARSAGPRSGPPCLCRGGDGRDDLPLADGRGEDCFRDGERVFPQPARVSAVHRFGPDAADRSPTAGEKTAA